MGKNLDQARSDKSAWEGNKAGYDRDVMAARERDRVEQQNQEARALVGPVGDALRAADAECERLFAEYEAVKDASNFRSPEATAAWKVFTMACENRKRCLLAAVETKEGA